MSPITNTSGCPGRPRFGSTRTRPSAACETPSESAKAGARTPVAHTMIPAAISLPSVSVTEAGPTSATCERSRTSTPRRSSIRCAAARSLGWKPERRRLARLEQNDARAREVELRELLTQGVPVDLGEGSGDLDTRRAAADNHYVERPGRHQLGIRGRQFKPTQHACPDAERVIEALERQAVLGCTGHAAEVRLEAGREHEIVEADPVAARENELVAVPVDTARYAKAEVEVVSSAEEASDRVCDVLDVQKRVRDLVDQRLEEVVVVYVDQRHVHGRLRECLCGLDAAHTSADDHHAGRGVAL